MKRLTRYFLMFSFILSCALAFAEAPQLVELDARLEIVAGQVRLTRVGSTKTDVINSSINLCAGDLLETLRESRAVLKYADGTEMRIQPRTLVEVQPMSIRVFKGKTWYRFVKRGSEFRIETPTLVAGIRGTEFEVAVTSRQKSFVMVLEGAVAVNNVGAESGGMLLRPGFATHSEPGSDLAPAYQFNLERKKAEWEARSWEPNGGADDINRLFIRYLNLKNEYGDDDARTQEALELFNERRNKK